jgi:hypothetical protein
VMGAKRSQEYLEKLPDTEVFFFVKDAPHAWKVVHRHGRRANSFWRQHHESS